MKEEEKAVYQTVQKVISAQKWPLKKSCKVIHFSEWLRCELTVDVLHEWSGLDELEAAVGEEDEGKARRTSLGEKRLPGLGTGHCDW